MNRSTVRDYRLSEGPQLVGICKENLQGCLQYLNKAGRRLIMDEAGGDEGFIGSFAEVAFYNLPTGNTHLTLARGMARLDALTVCHRPARVRNQLYEYLKFGNGRLPKTCGYPHGETAAYERNNVALQRDLTNQPQGLRAYASDPTDVAAGAQIFFEGLDQNGKRVLTPNAAGVVMAGEMLALATPFVDSDYLWNEVTGVQKDRTNGPVSVYQVDPNSGDEILVLTMEPTEQAAWYRRYYLNNLPVPSQRCSSPIPLEAKAIVKLDLLPLTGDLDYLMFNLEAMIEECQAIRLEAVDNTAAKQAGEFHHKRAVNILNGEVRHVIGVDSPSIRVPLFGSNRLRPSFR